MMLNLPRIGATLAVLMLAHGEPLRCQHPRCRYVGEDHSSYPLRYVYEVDGYNINFSYSSYNLPLGIYCNGADVLKSAALPRANPALLLREVELNQCPLPANGSLTDTLTALNVALDFGNQTNENNTERVTQRTQLTFNNLPASPPLTAKHFTGLAHLKYLGIWGYNVKRPERGFLAPLRYLHKLEIRDAVLPDGELEALPALVTLTLINTNVKRLPQIPALRYIRILSEITLDDMEVPPEAQGLELASPATSLRLNTTHDLEYLVISGWTELRPAPLTSCDSLDWLKLYEPTMVTLPDGWLEKCSRLAHLEVTKARNLTVLPPQLLIGANVLENLEISDGVLETLPAGLLDYTPNLRKLVLHSNHLKKFPSGIFVVPRMIRIVSLFSNDLDMDSLSALAQLQNLKHLLLNNNPRISAAEVCSSWGSPLRNFTGLKIYAGGAGRHQECKF